MASVCIPGKFNIDYSLMDGRIRSFELNGEVLFDETNGTNTDGWKGALLKVVKENNLDVDIGRGVYYFIQFLEKE